MSKLAVTDFSKRVGSPYHNNNKISQETVVHKETFQKTFDRQKEKQSELQEKVNKRTEEIKSNKPVVNDGCFTEVVSYGAFTKATDKKPVKANGTNGTKSPLLGFPSSANDLALDAKTDLESDGNISAEVKDKVIEKLFTLVSMVQHAYEAKVRVVSEFEKYKELHSRNEMRREKEHAEQMYKLNMNFQNEVVHSIQQLKSEIDISRNAKNVENGCNVDFNSDVVSVSDSNGNEEFNDIDKTIVE